MRCTGRGRPDPGRGLATVLGGVARVMYLTLSRNETFAPLLPAAAQDFPPALALHAGAEPELAFASPFRRLIGAFHGGYR